MIEKLEMQIRVERNDEIPAFGAFLRCEEKHNESHTILINVQASMLPEVEFGDGEAVSISRDERKRNLILNLMHEFGHALESHFRLPVNEDAIEHACEAWESAFANFE